MTILFGYQPTRPPLPACPYCNARHALLEKDKDGRVWLRCWCNAKCEVKIDDKELAELVAEYTSR